MAEAYKTNCKVLRRENGRVYLDLPRRKEVHDLPESWCHFKKRNVKPAFQQSESVLKYPTVLSLPRAMAVQAGLIQ